MRDVVGVIFAGGEGARLGGVRKADLRVGGVTLADRAVDLLAPHCSKIFLAGGDLSFSSTFSRKSLQINKDAPGPNSGPLSGLAGAVLAIEQQGLEPDYLATTAVDMPFFPGAFYAEADFLDFSSIFMHFASVDDQDYPTNALWRFDALRALPERILRGEELRGFRSILPKENTAPIAVATADVLNINTMSDLLTCQMRALKEH